VTSLLIHIAKDGKGCTDRKNLKGLFNMYETTGTRQEKYWHDCGTGSPPGGWDINPSIEELELLFDLTQCSDPEVIANGGFWNYRTVTYTTYVADKSDGFIPKNRTKWFANQPIVDGDVNTNGANINNENICFDGRGEADGGYNHWELRDLTRDYGSYGESRPMTVGKEWIQKRFKD